MDSISIIATARGTDEFDIANTYTTRQLDHIAKAYLKDKFLVVKALGDMLLPNSDAAKPKQPDIFNTPTTKTTMTDDVRDQVRKIKHQIGTFDLDGPLEKLAPIIPSVKRVLKKRKQNRG